MSDYQVDVSVSRRNIDTQLESIPTEILVWTREAADRVADVQRARNELKLVESKLSIAIRSNPLDYGHQKVTEDLVKALIVVQPEFQAAQEKQTQAECELASARAVVDALESKRSSLKYLAELTVSGYLGSTTVSVSQSKGKCN